MAKKKHIGKMRHRVVITNWIEAPDDDVNLVRTRPKIFEGWASIKERSFASQTQAAIYDHFKIDGLKSATHQFTIRTPSDVHITARHWLYVERRFGRREWYKIMSVGYADDRECMTTLECKLHEVDDDRTDEACIKKDPDPEQIEMQAAPDIDADCSDAPKKPRKPRKKPGPKKKPTPVLPEYGVF